MTYDSLMSALWVMALLQYAPSPAMHLVDAADTTSSSHSRVQLETQLAAMPTGWPVGAIVGAVVGYGLGAAGLVTAAVFMVQVGAEGLLFVMGVLIAGVALVPIIGAIVATVIGVSVANSRAKLRVPLEQELDGLRTATRQADPLVIVARF